MRKLKSLGLLVVVVVCISAVSVVFSAVPLRINYQGRYTENGTPVTGNRSFVFKIVESDGSPVYWTSGSVTINLQNGLFNYVLEPTGVDWPNIEPYFEVSVGPSAGEETLLSPRERINASAYAIYSSSAGYASAGGTTDHSALSNLDYASSGHTGFEATVTKGNLTANSPLSFDNTRQVIGGAAALSIADVASGSKGVAPASGAPATNEFLRALQTTGAVAWAQVSYNDLSNVPSTFTPSAHNLLSVSHGDTLAGTVVRGDILYGNDTPKWARLAHPGANYVLATNSTDVAWSNSPTLAGLNLGTGGLNTVGTITPAADSTYNLGTSAPRYFANAYIDRVYLNSSVYLDGITLADPNADQIMMWDDSASLLKFMAIGNGLNINATPVLACDSASETVDGVVELATIAETTAGTDATRAITPDGLAGSVYGKRVVCIKVIGETISLTTGDGQAKFTVPTELNGYNLVDADAAVYTPSTSGTPTIQIARVRAGGPNDMLSTRITIDVDELTSYTAATQPVINTSYDDVQTADFVKVDVDVAGTGTKGLDVILSFQLP